MWTKHSWHKTSSSGSVPSRTCLARAAVVDLVLVVSMVRITRIEKVKFRVVLFMLPDPSLKLWAISCNEICSLVNNVWKSEAQENKHVTKLQKLPSRSSELEHGHRIYITETHQAAPIGNIQFLILCCIPLFYGEFTLSGPSHIEDMKIFFPGRFQCVLNESAYCFWRMSVFFFFFSQRTDGKFESCSLISNFLSAKVK